MLLIALGFFRENLFVNINDLLFNKRYNGNNPVAHYLWFLNNVPYKTIYIAKWFITPLFAFLFWRIQKGLLWVVFSEKKLINWLGVFYITLFVLAGICFVTGWALGNINKGYLFSRMFMGLLESPAACMILIPTAYLYKQTNINQQ